MVREEFIEVLNLDPRMQVGKVHDKSKNFDSYTLFDVDNLILHIVDNGNGVFSVMHLRSGEEPVVRDSYYPWDMPCIRNTLRNAFDRQELMHRLSLELSDFSSKKKLSKV